MNNQTFRFGIAILCLFLRLHLQLVHRQPASRQQLRCRNPKTLSKSLLAFEDARNQLEVVHDVFVLRHRGDE